MEYPRPRWIQSFVSTMDLSGTPTCCVGPDDKLYFAIATKGTFAGTITSTVYNIVIGCVNPQGVTEWLLHDPSLVSNNVDTQPSLVMGPTGELYVAFMTTGNLPGTYNAADVVNLCGSCTSTAGRQDIVLARIDGLSVGIPSVSWRIQNGYLNSCSNEYGPTLYVDAPRERILIAYECNASTLCSTPVGTTNLVCASISIQGDFQWAYQGALLNGPGANQSPSVATDLSGNVYIAYTITSRVAGGGIMQGSQDVEVVRLRRQGSTMLRDWILSGQHIINSPGVNTDPHLVYDSNTNRLYLAFTATAAVPGGSKTASGSDLVLATIATTGSVLQLQQSSIFNEVSYRYSSIDHPRIALNQYGLIYITAHAISQLTGSDMILAFKINPGTGKQWFFRQGANEFNAYVAVADIPAPFQALYVAAPFSAPALATFAGAVYLVFFRQNSATLYALSLSQNINYLEYTAQEYMRNVVPIC